jgi:hypothetical protein
MGLCWICEIGSFYDAIHSIVLWHQKNNLIINCDFFFFGGLVVGCSRLHPCGVLKNEALVWSLCVGEFGTLQGRKDW